MADKTAGRTRPGAMAFVLLTVAFVAALYWDRRYPVKASMVRERHLSATQTGA